MASVHGTGYGSVGGTLTFNPRTEFQRPALLSDNGSIYVEFTAYCDYAPDSAQGHGWIFAYNASTLQLESNFVVTPNGIGGGIWASGGGPAADSHHNIYFSTGDGDQDAGGVDYTDSVLKLSSGRLALLDYFTPLNQAMLESDAMDLGSGGVLLLPTQSTSPPNLLVTAGKRSDVTPIYVINRDDMGHYTSQAVQVNHNIAGLFSTPTFWNNRLYFAGSYYTGNDSPKVFSFSNGRISANPTSQAAEIYPYPGAVTVVSANGTNNGILWALEHGETSSGTGDDVLHAYNALNLATELYNSDQDKNRDSLGVVGNQFESITVDNGKVYVPSSGNQHQLSVYGLLP
jgi:hypothetical protein